MDDEVERHLVVLAGAVYCIERDAAVLRARRLLQSSLVGASSFLKKEHRCLH